MGKILDRLLHTSPEDRARRKSERVQRKFAKEQAHKKAVAAELRAYEEGLVAGAKARGKQRGFDKGSGQGGITGTMQRIGAGMDAFTKGAEKFSDVDIGKMGQGLGSGSAFGFGFGEQTRKKTTKKKRKRK